MAGACQRPDRRNRNPKGTSVEVRRRTEGQCRREWALPADVPLVHQHVVTNEQRSIEWRLDKTYTRSANLPPITDAVSAAIG
jgi:hypothetical protein